MSTLASDIRVQLERCELSWVQALQKQDAVELNRLLHDEFTSTPARSKGEVVRKREYIASASEVQVCDYELRDSTVSQSDNVAVFKARLICHSKFGGRHLDDDLLITDVWVRVGDAWLALTRHASHIS